MLALVTVIPVFLYFTYKRDKKKLVGGSKLIVVGRRGPWAPKEIDTLPPRQFRVVCPALACHAFDVKWIVVTWKAAPFVALVYWVNHTALNSSYTVFHALQMASYSPCYSPDPLLGLTASSPLRPQAPLSGPLPLTVLHSLSPAPHWALLHGL